MYSTTKSTRKIYHCKILRAFPGQCGIEGKRSGVPLTDMSGFVDPNHQFSSARRLFWPIHGDEIKKFLPLTFMMFFILFNYTILRNTKDTLVITASGPEVIPFLKAVVILPFSILIVACYAKLSNVLSRQSVFYIVLGTFMSIYIGYALFIHPHTAALHMAPERLKALKIAYPNFQHLFSVVGNWSSSLFYLFAELWGATILSLMFWQFANEITRVYEARRFYAMFGLIGHLALMAAGYVGQRLCDIRFTLGNTHEGWTHFINYMVLSISISGVAIALLYYWTNRYVLTDPKYYDGIDKIGTIKAKKPKLSLKDSFAHIIRSKYLGYIAIMVLGYGITMNLTGIMWKKQVQLQYPNALEYANFMSQFSFWIGVITITLIFFLKGTVDRFGWYRAAMITPVIVIATILPFFAFMFYRDILTPFLSPLGGTALLMAVLIGASQQILCKSAKYSMFDPTKEMAYIPLDQELKVKGKAAVDVTCYSLAKASGGYMAGILLIITAASDLMVIAPYLAVIVLVIVCIWVMSVKHLSRLYYHMVGQAAAPAAPK
jgi:AAA family ATP:ADP antiporter